MKKYFFIFFIFLSACSNMSIWQKTRKLVVVGSFYTNDFQQLNLEIDNYLKNIIIKNNILSNQVKAIMVPHAGLAYSGSVSAKAYKYLENRKINTVVLISNAHTDYFSGIAIDNNDYWQAPFGKIKIDKEFANSLIQNKRIKYNKQAHKNDHTLEVQLPFLQKTLKPGFKILPILFGQTNKNDYKVLARLLAKNLKENDLIVISSDMSHYPSYEDAQLVDKETLNIIKEVDIEKLDKHIEKSKEIIKNEETILCGVDAVKTIMYLCNILNWQESKILGYENSGDKLQKNKNRVVGYGAVLFASKKLNNMDKNILNREEKTELLNIVKTTIRSFIGQRKIPSFKIKNKKLLEKQGAFVTLKVKNKLRGCMGMIIANKPLWEIVREMAISASVNDYRFKPINKNELNDIQYEVSVLSKPKRIYNWQNIKLGKDGVIIENGNNKGVFLPQVAKETNWSLEQFLSELCMQKANLTKNCYKDNNTKLYIFNAQVFESE